MNNHPQAFSKKRPALLLFLAAGLLGILIAAAFVIDEGHNYFASIFSLLPQASTLSCLSVPQEEFGLKPDPDQAELDAALLDTATRDLSEKYQEFKSQRGAALEQQLKNLAKTRKKHLVDATRHNPGKAFLSLLTSAERDTLLLSTSNCVENIVTLEGTLEVVHADFFADAMSTTQYTLITKEGERIVI